jgi:putative salt-induced outer membrane protein YdiY
MAKVVLHLLWGLGAASALVAPSLRAQDTAPAPAVAAPDHWSGSVGFGLAFTSGNSDTRSYNLSFTAVHDPKTRNVFKAEGLHLRAEQESAATADKTSLGLRDEFKLSGPWYVFGELRFLRDRFQQLDALVAPLGGVGLRAVGSPRVQLNFDVGLGGAFEKLEGTRSTFDGALQAGQSLTLKLSSSATFTQGATALWKLDDFGDAFYRLTGGLTTAVSRRLELKLAYTRDIKTRPVVETLEQSDDSLVANLVFKL